MTNWLFSDIPNGPVMSKVQYNVSGLVYIVSFLIRRQRKMKVCDTLHLIYDEPVWYHFILLNDKNEIFKFLKYTKHYRLRLWVHKENCKYIRARADFVEWLEKKYNDPHHPLHTWVSIFALSNRKLRNLNILPKYKMQLFKNSFVYKTAISIQSGKLNDRL